RLLTLADYDHPYRTMDPAYEAETLELFAQLVEKNLVYRALKSVHWSIENRTALAEAELEYYEREDESVYVEFEAADKAALARAFGLEDLDRTPTFMIWTTTPWTLPANLAIAVQPQAEYALIDLAGSLTVVAAKLVERVASRTDSKARTLATCPGERLVGLRYRHPLYDEPAEARLRALGADPKAPLWTIVPAEHVTLEDGTGLVHTAPGHGREDELVGRACGLPIYCPVRDDGSYDRSVPEHLQGLRVWEANARIVEQLRDSGHLHHSERVRHSYPHDWRGKSPVIFRATEQWFIRVDGDGAEAPNLRRLGLEATQRDIEFIPPWGRSRLQGMLESRPDWCISRQRAWGLPIPAFVDREGRVLLTAASVRAVAKVVREEGSDAWFTRSASELLAGYDAASDPQAPQGLDLASLEKTYDIFDVWFESGSSWRAVMQQRGFGFPCDLYLEGSDQHRGWFQVSLLTALGAEGRAPFRTLLTHGFMVDKDGRAMSKSLGN
ncbi:MAG: isoleucine--tRNA ligase, partial [Planctomycetota bacterium]